MKKFRGKRRITCMVVILAIALSLISLLYKRTETCGVISSDSGVALCVTFGPRTYRGYPFGVTYETTAYIEALQQEGIQIKTNYWPILFNIVFYAIWIAILLYLIKILKLSNQDKHNNIDVK